MSDDEGARGAAPNLTEYEAEMQDYLVKVTGISLEQARELIETHRGDTHALQRDVERLQSQSILNFFKSNSSKR